MMLKIPKRISVQRHTNGVEPDYNGQLLLRLKWVLDVKCDRMMNSQLLHALHLRLVILG